MLTKILLFLVFGIGTTVSLRVGFISAFVVSKMPVPEETHVQLLKHGYAYHGLRPGEK